MRTLSQWVSRFSQTPTQIPCREMRLLRGRDDWAPPTFVGVGELRLDTPASLRFVMHAKTNVNDALQQLNECNQFPYDVGHAFALRVTDYDGVEWACGLTQPQVIFPYAWGPELLLEGELSGLSAAVEGAAPERGFELFFSPAPRLVPFSEHLITTARIGNTEIGHMVRGGRHACEILGSTIEVSRDPWSENMWLCATPSSQLDHPFIETWLSQPLRVLFGQLVYPRLTAYNFGNGRAYVTVSPCPPLRSNVAGCIEVVGRTAQPFWSFYGRYLMYLAKYPASEGLPHHYGNNPLTHYHEEVIQAASGSRWMFALAVAGAIEGVCKEAARPGGLPQEFADPDVESLRAHLKTWQGNEEMRRRLGRSLNHFSEPSPGAFLGQLVAQSVIREDHQDAWAHVRNRVMHGRLIDPWPDEESETRLKLLLDLFYKLTVHVVQEKP